MIASTSIILLRKRNDVDIMMIDFVSYSHSVDPWGEGGLGVHEKQGPNFSICNIK